MELSSDETGYVEIYSPTGVLLNTDKLFGGVNSINLGGLQKVYLFIKLLWTMKSRPITNWLCWSKFIVLLVLILLQTSTHVYSQKEDRNWCFGYNAGISFTDINTPISFKTKSKNLTMSSSVSDGNGVLEFYVTATSLLSRKFLLRDSDNTIIPGSDSLNFIDNGASSQAIFKINDSTYYILHVGEYLTQNCPYIRCLNLYYSVVIKSSTYGFFVSKKNISIVNEPIETRFTSVKHSNGNDWWLYVHGLKTNNISSTNRFYRILLRSDSIYMPIYQDVGTQHISMNSIFSEMTTSKNGNFLASCIDNQKTIDLFKINRCDGQLEFFDNVTADINPYSCEFSNNESKLYITQGVGIYSNTLFQLDLDSKDDSLSKLNLWSTTDSLVRIGQLQIGPDNKIYMSSGYGNSLPNFPYSPYNQNLSVINNPDSAGVACDFQPFSFYLGDSSRALFGLPNMPNYNLGPTSIYAADAGNDTVFCSNISSGIKIGIAKVENVQYSWFPSTGLSNTSIAQPIAAPSEDTWYYLTLTDTTIEYSCQSRTDSVFVKVEICSSTEDLNSSESKLSIYPNPTQNILYIKSTSQNHEVRNIHIIDLNGRNVIYTKQSPINTSELSQGIYFYQVEMSGGEVVRGKFLKN
ncbi:MAG: T9SS type A sorting domain-containing protein [Chitinophagales bacterium]